MDQIQDEVKLQSFGDSIWTMDGDDVRMFGALPFTTRMTIVKLQSGGLWLHSPILPTPGRQQVIDQLGPVQHLIAPNKIHSLGIDPWRALYPTATVWASPEFTKRHQDIAVDFLLTQETDTPWREEIDFRIIQGHALLDEVAFFHKASRSLVITDLIQKHDASGEAWVWRCVKCMAGVLGKDGGVSLDIKLSIRNRQAMRKSIAHLMNWNFDNLIIAHGHCVRDNARSDVSRAFDWIIKGGK